jgi:hypothetical protein
MTIACADCGCLVDRGIRVESCADPDCCCRHLPVATADDTMADSRAATGVLSDRSRTEPLPMDVRSGAAPRPTWATAREALTVVLYRRHLRATIRIAAVVGTVLFAINQLDVVVTGRATTATWVKVAVTYLVPFTVANLGILTATRRTKA